MKVDYNFRPEDEFPYRTLNEGARELDISPQRMSRLMKILGIGVHRKGYTLLLSVRGVDRVKKALETEEVRPGRKRKGQS